MDQYIFKMNIKIICLILSYCRKSRPSQLYSQHNYSSSNTRNGAPHSGLSNGTPSNSSLSIVKSCENVYESNVNTCPVIIWGFWHLVFIAFCGRISQEICLLCSIINEIKISDNHRNLMDAWEIIMNCYNSHQYQKNHYVILFMFLYKFSCMFWCENKCYTIFWLIYLVHHW